MTSNRPIPTAVSGARIVLGVALFCTLALAQIPTAQAQAFTVLHNFTGGNDGANPFAGVTLDHGGNVYGTTKTGAAGFGTAFKLTHRNSAWILNTLYTFHGEDGEFPLAKPIFGPDGALYGTTSGGFFNYGTVFRLAPPANVCQTTSCPWIQAVLYQFMNSPDGAGPNSNPVIFDSAGNLYGATEGGGQGNCDDAPCGTVYELSPGQGNWVETVLYRFRGSDGAVPNGVVLDNAGNLYGTTLYAGPAGYGGVFQLHDNGGIWSLVLLHNFSATDGGIPEAGVILDGRGNLYGATGWDGAFSGGTAFEIDAQGNFSTLYSFTDPGGHGIFTGPGPAARLMMDAAGNLYGTTYSDGLFGYGAVFKLTHTQSGWSYTSLHDFTGGSDGGYPISDIVIDSAGNLYGTASVGGNVSCNQGAGCGLVFEITP